MTTAALHAPWPIAATFLNLIADIFGLPEEIAQLGMIKRELYDKLHEWLRAAEALVRRLLLIEASHVELGAPRNAKPRFRETRVSAKPRAPSFRVFTDGPAIKPLRYKPRPERRPPPERFPAAPLAARFEAMIAAVVARAAWARRVARRLAREPLLAFGLTRHPPSAPRLIGVDDFRSTNTQTFAALRAVIKSDEPEPPP